MDGSTLPTGGWHGRSLLTHARRPLRVAREVTFVLVLWTAYDAGRLLRAKGTHEAFANANRVLGVERWMHLPREQHLQALFLSATPVIETANAYYAAVHLPLTGLALLWLMIFRRNFYRRTRNALFAATAVALTVYLLIPVAPPRKLPGDGFVDTAMQFGQSVYTSSSGTTVANQFAAMPSLHVGWALLIAVALIRSSKTKWRWLWIAHPIMTFLVVVATGNHFWLDGIAGALLVVGAYSLFKDPSVTPPVEAATEHVQESPSEPSGQSVRVVSER